MFLGKKNTFLYQSTSHKLKRINFFSRKIWLGGIIPSPINRNELTLFSSEIRLGQSYSPPKVIKKKIKTFLIIKVRWEEHLITFVAFSILQKEEKWVKNVSR